MLRFIAALALVGGAHALTCKTSGDSSWPADCSGATVKDICYYGIHGGDSDEDEPPATFGCLPAKHVGGMIDAAEAGCSEYGCWCLTADCNTPAWFTSFKASYTPPAVGQCYTGIAGSNTGPSCDKTAAYKAAEFEQAQCDMRITSEECFENQDGLGHGDCHEKANQSDCEAFKADDPREADESYDGTTNYCHWFPALANATAKENACTTDDKCAWNASGNANAGSCEHSASSNSSYSTWQTARGTECEQRMAGLCLGNSDGWDKKGACTQNEDATTCANQATEDDSDESPCSSDGECTGTASAGEDCTNEGRQNEPACKPSENCTWTPGPCCKWIPAVDDDVTYCQVEANATDGYCSYSDGNGPPKKEMAGLMFEHKLARLSNKFNGKCSLIATYRAGKGGAVAFGSNRKDMIGSLCMAPDTWKSFGENVGHTDASVDEYCTNFLPSSDGSAMKALKDYSPAYLIMKAKQGKFKKFFPQLPQLFIVKTAPGLGECLFVGKKGSGEFGAAICTCATKSCNGQAALEALVDADTGPMRLLKFLDGSLSNLKTAINAKIPGILNADGTINAAKVGDATDGKLAEIYAIDGVSDLVTLAELKAIVADFKALKVAKDKYENDKPAKVKAVQAVAAAVITKMKNAMAGKTWAGLFDDDNNIDMDVLATLSETALEEVVTAAADDSITLEVLQDAQAEALEVVAAEGGAMTDGDDSGEDPINVAGAGDASGTSGAGKLAALGVAALAALVVV